MAQQILIKSINLQVCCWNAEEKPESFIGSREDQMQSVINSVEEQTQGRVEVTKTQLDLPLA